MLAAGATRPVDIHLQVFRPDLDVAIVLDLRDHLDQRERRVPPVGLVVGREPDQAMHTALGAEPAERTLARDADRDALVAGLFPWGLVDDLGGHLVAFRPAEIHPQQHLRPVLRVGTAGAGVDADQRGIIGVGVGEEEVDLLTADIRIQRGEVVPEGVLQMPVVLRDRHLREADHVLGARFQLPPHRELIAQPFGFLREPLRARGILPEVGVV